MACLFLWLGLAAGAWAGPAPARPNVVIVLADQWRAQAFGYAGDPNVRTPRIDALQRESVWCVNAISGVPVCCPARASLLTGQRALTHGVFLNDVPLPAESRTLAKAFREAGYDTAYIGKWHLDGRGRSNFIPRERRQGFDYWKALECTHNYNESCYYADGPEKLKWEGYDAEAQTRDAIGYLKQPARRDKPFLLVLAWGPPHDPYHTAPERYRAMYAPERIGGFPNIPARHLAGARKNLAGYYAHGTALDTCLGELRDGLRAAGLDRNTLFLFTSDHGDMVGGQGAYNKQRPYDESIRVPLLVHWPAGLGCKPRRITTPINMEDIMPTILGLCQLPVPATVEGLDFSRHLRGGRNPSDGAALYACVAPFGQWTREQGGRECRGLRTERYTFVRDLQGPWLLFDNLKDPWQTNNLAGLREHARLQRKLEGWLDRKLAAAGDRFLPASEYIRQWGWTVDATGTVPYQW